MGLFDEIRKRRELSNLEKKILSGEARYEDLPTDLKEDIDYLLRIADLDKKIYHKISLDLFIKLVMLKPELGEIVDRYTIVSILDHIKNNNEIKIDYKKLFSHIPFDMSYSILKDIPKEEYKNIFSIEEQVKIIEKELNVYEPTINNDLLYFDINAIYELVKMRKQRDDESRAKTPPSDYRGKLNDLDIKSFPIDVQIHIAGIDPYFINKMSDEAIFSFTNDNSYLIDSLDAHRQSAAIDKIYQKYNTKEQLWPLLSIDKFQLTPEEKKILTVPNAKKFLALQYFDQVDKMTDYFRNDDLVELAKFNAKAASLNWLIPNYRKPKYLSKMYFDYVSKHADLYNCRALLTYLDTSGDEIAFFQKIGYRWNDVSPEYRNKFNLMTKVLLNDTILNKCDGNKILELIKNPDNRDLMLEIVGTAFGEEARKILEDRPEITHVHIPSFDIFDRKIIETFGTGTIHNILSYDNTDGNILGELARHPEKLERFKQFSEILKDHFSDSAIDFHKKLDMFMDLDDILLEKVDLKTMSQEDKENLSLLVTDRYHNIKTRYEFVATSPSELHDYKTRRNQIFDEVIEKSNNPVVLKNALFSKFFGIDYYNRSSVYTPSTSDFAQLRIRYSLDTFLTNTKTMDYTDLTNEELDMLEVAYIISEINDVDILKDLYHSLGERTDILSPSDFKTIREKTSNTYTKALIDSLTTIDKMEQMVVNGVEGISHSKNDDIDVYHLDGAPFRMFIHTPGLNNSGIQVGDWMSLEEGISTISGCLIEPFLLESCAREGSVSYGFTSIEPTSISGMGHTDIHSSHVKRQLETSFDFGRVDLEYPDELVRKTRAQIDGTDRDIQSDIVHKYNEVTLYRREHDPSKIKEGTFGGKRIPDYIVSYGDYGLARAKKDAEYFAAYNDGKPLPVVVIDVEKYRQARSNAPEYIYRKVESHIEREPSDLVSDIREVGGRSR